MTWPDEHALTLGYWWRDGDDARFIPWPERTVLPKLQSGCYDGDEIACMREQCWAKREGLC